MHLICHKRTKQHISHNYSKLELLSVGKSLVQWNPSVTSVERTSAVLCHFVIVIDFSFWSCLESHRDLIQPARGSFRSFYNLRHLLQHNFICSESSFSPAPKSREIKTNLFRIPILSNVRITNTTSRCRQISTSLSRWASSPSVLRWLSRSLEDVSRVFSLLKLHSLVKFQSSRRRKIFHDADRYGL